MKNPLTPPGIEPATFRFVAQHLNHCATAVPYIYIYIYMCVCVCVCVSNGKYPLLCRMLSKTKSASTVNFNVRVSVQR